MEQAWFRVLQSLEPFDAAQFQDHTATLLQVADKLDIDRLTPIALALVVRARTLSPAQAGPVLRRAVELDPVSPEARFALAAFSLRQWSLPASARSAATGLVSLFTDERLDHIVGSSAAISALLGALAALAFWAALVLRRASGMLWHDLMELGGWLRLGPNAMVLAIAVIALPLLTSGDVVVLLLWVVALSWAYFSTYGKLVGVVALTLIMATPTISEVAFRLLTRPPNALIQASAALAGRRYDPQLLEELDSVGDIFGDQPLYHRLHGDLCRQFGLLDAAGLSYREGLRISPGDGRLSLALGSVRYLEGDFNAALQAFQTARSAGADPVVSNYNLSLTLAQTYNFRESDEAMELARQADIARFRELTRGREHMPVFAATTTEEVEALLATMDPVELLNRGLIPPPLLRERSLGHPLSLLAFVMLLFAVGHFLVRERLGGLASSCLKCGRSFCRRCKLTQESQSYCAQCVTIFLKKDTVTIEAQMAKRKQLSRYQTLLRVERRIADVAVPGLGLAEFGRPVLGGLLAITAVAAATSTVLWLPHFIAPALMDVSVAPLQLATGSIWLAAAVLAQLVTIEVR